MTRVLAGAVAKDILTRVGERGGSRCKLSDEIVLRAGSAGMEVQSRKGQMLYDAIQQEGASPLRRGWSFWARAHPRFAAC
ncbi:MAG: hypothetical protein F4X28_08705 [Acidimicrobiaceae bacterium]|nr:hypothetical protein [Acidimicrobiaceae bacterium]